MLVDGGHGPLLYHPLFKLIPLADIPRLCEQCIQLLNEEWPRSTALREHSMRKSMNKEPPLALILLDDDDSLIGHARLCPLPGDDAIWIESIVIWKQLRGRGIGRVLMQKIERWSGERGFTKMFLSTEDKADFYAKCGFSRCPPVLNFGANSRLFKKGGLGRFLGEFAVRPDELEKESGNSDARSAKTVPSNVPTPPPAPPSPTLSVPNVVNKIYMMKRI